MLYRLIINCVKCREVNRVVSGVIGVDFFR